MDGSSVQKGELVLEQADVASAGVRDGEPAVGLAIEEADNHRLAVEDHIELQRDHMCHSLEQRQCTRLGQDSLQLEVVQCMKMMHYESYLVHPVENHPYLVPVHHLLPGMVAAFVAAGRTADM